MATERRWMAVGRSISADALTAAREAVGSAVAGHDDTALVVLFASDSLDLTTLVREARRLADAPLIGCSTAGEIATDGPGDAGVVAVAFGGPGFRVSTSLAGGTGQRPREAGEEAAGVIADVADSPHRVLMLLTDGLSGDQQEIVRGAYGVAGAGVPLVGGCAGDDLHMVATRQFFDDQVLRDSVVAAAIGSDAPLGIGVRHGWRTVGEPMIVTQSAGNEVATLDDRPALDLYLERLGAPPEVRDDAAAFSAYAMTHPLGMSRRTGEEQVRTISGVDLERGVLQTFAPVPQGGLVWVMDGDDESVLAATDAACADAIGALDGADPQGFVVFDCMARRGVLGDVGIGREIGRVAEHAHGAPVAGFYTYGEIARTQGVTGFHNQTLVILAVA